MTQKSTEFLYPELTEKIIGTAFEVYKILGYGFLEKIYKKSLIYELKLKNIQTEEEYPIRVKYKNKIVGDYFADLFIEKKVIIEIKTEEYYNKIHEAQLLNYLKATGVRIGLLLNFGRMKCEFKRLIF